MQRSRRPCRTLRPVMGARDIPPDPQRPARPRRPLRLRRRPHRPERRDLRQRAPHCGAEPHRRRHLSRQPPPGDGRVRGRRRLRRLRRLFSDHDQGRHRARRPGDPGYLAGDHGHPLRRHRRHHAGQLPAPGRCWRRLHRRLVGRVDYIRTDQARPWRRSMPRSRRGWPSGPKLLPAAPPFRTRPGSSRRTGGSRRRGGCCRARPDSSGRAS